MKYSIWKYFSREARRAAATASYDGDGETADGCCPLGVALCVDRGSPAASGRPYWTAPSAARVAEEFRDDDDVRHEARAFIDDWDRKRIDPADLPVLLEVESL